MTLPAGWLTFTSYNDHDNAPIHVSRAHVVAVTHFIDEVNRGPRLVQDAAVVHTSGDAAFVVKGSVDDVLKLLGESSPPRGNPGVEAPRPRREGEERLRNTDMAVA